MLSKMEEVKVLRIINMDVMVAGSIFWGECMVHHLFHYAILKDGDGDALHKAAESPCLRFSSGYARHRFTHKIYGILFKEETPGRDNAEVYVPLQKRWEDSNGKLYAQRVGTGRERYDKSVPRTSGHELKIHYGDITRATVLQAVDGADGRRKGLLCREFQREARAGGRGGMSTSPTPRPPMCW